ncbi:MAG: orotidine-5'-phosphate decarboxylase [Chlamydiota bacterium]
MSNTQLSSKHLPYIQRATMCANPSSKELFLIMEEKRSNLAVAIDVTTKEELLFFAKALAPHVCAIKTHIDMITNFDIHLLLELQDLANKHRVLIIEDRKFADIGKTSKSQYEGGIYKIANWAHLVTAHSTPGPGVIEGIRKTGLQLGRGMLLLAEMSSQGSLATGTYTEATVQMAQQYSDFVIGFISQQRLTNEPYFVHMTPGVSLTDQNGAFRQQYRTPEEAIHRDGCDLIIVGSSIINAADPVKAAKDHQQAGWEAHEKRLGN